MKVEQNMSYTNMLYSNQTKKTTSVEQSTFINQVKNKEDMSLEEYKVYFNEKMDALYTHPSQINMNWVIDITDAAYKKMQNDSAYEEKILNALAINKAVDFGGNIPQIAYTHVDDTWEGCYGYTKGMKANDEYVKGTSINNVKNDKKRKTEKNQKKQYLDYIQKCIEERKYLQKLRTEEFLRDKEQVSELNKRAYIAKAYDKQILEETIDKTSNSSLT